jgi:hypothetical protein
MRFAALFRDWMSREGITRSQASGRLGVGLQAPYGYAAGTHLPQRRYVADLARKMGLDEQQVRQAVETDRAERRAVAAAGHAGAAASVSPGAPSGAGW